MDDIAWLHARTTVVPPDGLSAAATRELLIDAHEVGVGTALVAPTHLPLVPEQMVRACRVGYPSGRHHSLIKAAEARLAVEYGASEIWLRMDPTVDDENAVLAEVVAVRQAVPPPVTLVAETGFAETAVRGGADEAGEAGTLCDTLDDAVAALEAGAARVFTARPGFR